MQYRNGRFSSSFDLKQLKGQKSNTKNQHPTPEVSSDKEMDPTIGGATGPGGYWPAGGGPFHCGGWGPGGTIAGPAGLKAGFWGG